MSRYARTILIVMLVFTGGIMISHSQEDMVVVDNQSFSNPQRSPALFPHDAHNEKAGIEDCSECHHVYENGVKQENESSEDRSCSDCHTSVDEGNTPGLMKAFHRNCKGCHETQKKGPVMCGECHPWR
jgi:hypothetical protein